MTKKITISILLSASLLVTPGTAFASLPNEEETSKSVPFFNFSETTSLGQEIENENKSDKDDYSSGQNAKEEDFIDTHEKASSELENAEEEDFVELPTEEASASSKNTRAVCPFLCNLI